jgi:sterol desaturase/sphingolipid hydroxylase (fatty acid hydroxylase superfamily)
MMTIFAVLAAMAFAALVETAIPLREHARSRARVGVNLSLCALALGLYSLLGAGLVLVLARLEPRGISTIAAILALDAAAWAAHAAMHKVPVLWRVHRVHHADPAVDVTTSLRQHPGETLIRFSFQAVTALALGVSPAAYAVYRAASAFMALFEHANIRLPVRLDGALSLAITSPNLHKVHHARELPFTDTNYGNLFSFWDRLARTFTPARFATDVAYGLASPPAPPGSMRENSSGDGRSRERIASEAPSITKLSARSSAFK